MVNLKVNFGGLSMKNPITTASGTFGYGEEYSQFYDLSRLGGMILKGTSVEPRLGNKGYRIAETPAGMLNSVGLQNPGVHYAVEHYLPWLQQFDVAKIANIVGYEAEDYAQVVSIFDASKMIDAYEINISCPNVKQGGMAHGANAKTAAHVMELVRKETKLPVIVKLSPNVTDICEIAKAVEAAGADGLSINTFLGMAIDVKSRRPVLGNITGGLSGPAIKPLSLRIVYQLAHAVSIPIMGVGGITTATDAIEYFLAGASAVSMGTANFINPFAPLDVIDGIAEWLEKEGETDINAIVGGLKC